MAAAISSSLSLPKVALSVSVISCPLRPFKLMLPRSTTKLFSLRWNEAALMPKSLPTTPILSTTDLMVEVNAAATVPSSSDICVLTDSPMVMPNILVVRLISVYTWPANPSLMICAIVCGISLMP